MKKLFTTLLCGVISTTAFGQWSRTTMQGESLRPGVAVEAYYSLDLNAIRGQLKNASEMGKGAQAVYIDVPTLGGKIEKFAVYSNPVVVKSLADRYQLGSYSGVSTTDPTKFIRFSVSPYDFSSMIIQNGKMEFVEPQNSSKTVYGVHGKTDKTKSVDGKSWLCDTTEPITTKAGIEKMLSKGNSFANNLGDFNKASDQKYRTMRLAMSVTGEYTQYFGGVPQALSQINATLTRCNGVFEKDFALHLNLQDFPQLIYADPNTDPYSPASQMGNWNVQLQQTLTSVIGNDAYDIGHLFGATGGGGNAGCIGCVCINPTSSTSQAKGSGFTSPADGKPFGDNFDIDYVAHEMGHQLGANHTFSMSLEGTGQNVEPGSGSTIMGYAGITGATDVQAHSDAYFHINSIIQVQNNLAAKICDVETAIPSQAPIVTAMSDYNIPKNTAFVLTGQATSPGGFPLTYTWEQTDSATQTTSKANLGTLAGGPNFRSWMPTAAGNTRYFPKFSTVLNGALKNTNDWEAASTVARTMNFKLTARDNNPTVEHQQTGFGTQKVVVGADGPFKITSTKVFNNASGPLEWDVVNTNNAPYNVENVKIDYSMDGNTWTVLAASTPNDGTENFSFPSLTTGDQVYFRVSAIGNIFYAVSKLTVSQIVACDGSAPVNVNHSNVTSSSATISWDAVSGATYVLRYRVVGDATWTQVPVSSTSYNLTGLVESTNYEYQVAAVCSGTTGTYSAVKQFTTSSLAYCSSSSNSSTYEYISNVTVTPQSGSAMSNTSGASTYTDFSSNSAKYINLNKGTSNNQISVTKAWANTTYNEAVSVWIDFDRNGVFDASERILNVAPSKTTPVTATFAVPMTAYSGPKILKMRVIMSDAAISSPCGTFSYGEVEDYGVLIGDVLGTSDATKTQGVQVYPNPAVNELNITNVSRKATYTIYSTSGQVVDSGAVSDSKVKVSQLTKGVYIIDVKDNDSSSKVKFIKK